MGVVADLNPAAVGALTLVQLSVSQTVDDAIFRGAFCPDPALLQQMSSLLTRVMSVSI